MAILKNLQPIGNGRNIFVSNNHTFGTDAILLANFANAKKSDRAVDLGTGCGIIPLLWARENAPSFSVGIDISDEAVYLANESVKLNNFEHSPQFLKADIKTPFDVLKKSSFSLVSCNPPYKADGAGIKSKSSADIVARHETLCTLEDVIVTAAALLSFGGRLVMCQRPERLGEIFSLMSQNRIEPKRLRLVCKQAESEPWLVLVEGRRDGGKGLKIEKNLVMYNKDGAVTDEVVKIYGEYGNTQMQC